MPRRFPAPSKRVLLLRLPLLACAALLLGAAPAPVTQPSLQDRCDKVLADWKPRLDAEHFNYTVSPPFILAGNGTPAQIRGYRDRTVLSAAGALHTTFFKAEPTEPILILLFESEEPYRRLAKAWCGDDTVPHYGYCRADNVMLMNVATGTGTLVHELTHALIRPDFPDVPSWFNEGLASLFEQCSLANGTIAGAVNWRLPALQRAIRDGKLRPLPELMNDPRFYREDLVGLNYAQARYLMYYLQEKRLLVKYYTAFRDGVHEDPTGEHTLEKVISPQKMADFENDWKAWVLTLNFG